MKFEDTSQEEAARQQRCAQSERQDYILLAHGRMGPPAASMKEPEEREFVVDSGASMHIVSKKDLDSAELETMRISRNPTTVMTANGEVQTREEATVYVKELDFFVTVMLLEETPTVLSLGKLCEDHGYTLPVDQRSETTTHPKGKNIDCNISNYVSFVVPRLSTSSSASSTPTSSTSSSKDPTSSSQDSVLDINRYTENPATERNGSTSDELRGNPLHRPTKTKNTQKMKDTKKYRAIYCMNCRTGCGSSGKIWSMKEVLQSRGTTRSLDIETLPSHELPMESRAKVEPGSGKHSIETHFPKDRNCDICLKTKKRGHLAEDALVQSCPERKILVI